ncbi:MAG: 3-deoxy-8-phosphooctulonate synthase, partial [Aquificota bacterium]
MLIIAGPCVIEGEDITLRIAQEIRRLADEFPEFSFVFKASF